MGMLSFVQPQNYLIKIAALLIGCLILGFGVYTEVLADVAMLPGESFVRAVVEVWHTEFGITKVVFDVSMAVIAAILSVIFTQTLQGVREGTVIVGRAADYVLQDQPNFLKVFFHASLEARIKRISARDHITEKEAEKKIVKEEKLRAGNYRYYTHRVWGFSGNYDISLDTGIGIDRIESILRQLLPD